MSQVNHTPNGVGGQSAPRPKRGIDLLKEAFGAEPVDVDGIPNLRVALDAAPADPLAAVPDNPSIWLFLESEDVSRARKEGLRAERYDAGIDFRGLGVVVVAPATNPYAVERGRATAEYALRFGAADVRVISPGGWRRNHTLASWFADAWTVDDLVNEAAAACPLPPIHVPAEPEPDQGRADQEDDIPWLDVARPDDPFTIAALHRRQYKVNGLPTLIHHKGEFLLWRDSSYRPLDATWVRGDIAQTTHDHLMWLNANATIAEKDRRKVSVSANNGVVLALQSLSQIDGDKEEPCWLGDDEPFPAGEILPARNMLLHLPSLVANNGVRADMPPTPAFYTRFALDYDIDLNAPPPTLWHEFLDQAFPGDKETVDALQEVFGLALTADTTQQKIFGLIGPRRAGKGVVARVLTRLVGKANVAGQTLSSMAGNFGLQPLIGKRLCIVDDARLTGRSDLSIITERLLSISGEATLTIDVKNKPAWTGKLPTRLVVLSNEIPRLPDPSGALAGRFIILRFSRSFYGKEDPGLTSKLLDEIPGILLWAVEGWRRLNARGYFQQPASGGELVEQLLDLSSPVGQFIRERCEVGPGREIVTGDLFDAWKGWCVENGRDHPGTAQSFARDLKAAASEVMTSKPTTRPGRQGAVRLYLGIGLKVAF